MTANPDLRRVSSDMKLTKKQSESIEIEWNTQKPLLLTCIEEKFGELNSALIRGEQDAIRKNERRGYRSITQDKEELDATRSAIICKFLLENKFFSNQNKGVQNAALRKRAERSVKLKIAAIRRANQKRGFDSSLYPQNGHDFEYWVAENLKIFGWQASVTVGSGDQGVDILANLNGKKLAIQCKRYQGNVGNKAVQEAHAGGIYYRADAAAVITNASYTRSATELAKSIGVMLCQIDSIPTLSNLFNQHLRRQNQNSEK